MLEVGMRIKVDGQIKTVANWQAEWSLVLRIIPHMVFIKWEGEEKYTRYLSDDAGDFTMLDVVN